MYVRLVELTDADTEKHDRVIETMRETIVPALREFDGFAGFLGLYGDENQQARAVLLWETREAAEAAETELVPRRRKIFGDLGLTLGAQDLYEAPVVDVGAVRA
jgi:hypothetical protein